MIAFLKYRIAVVTIFFTAFGGAMAKIFEVDELAARYLGFSFLIAVVMNLLVSFLLKGEWNVGIRKKTQRIAIILFVLLIASFAVHVTAYEGRVFRYHVFDGDTYLVKGDRYTPLGDSLQRSKPTFTPGDILNHLGGPSQNSLLWDNDSLVHNRIILVGTFVMVVIFFSAIASLLLEILTIRYRRRPNRG